MMVVLTIVPPVLRVHDNHFSCKKDVFIVFDYWPRGVCVSFCSFFFVCVRKLCVLKRKLVQQPLDQKGCLSWFLTKSLGGKVREPFALALI